MTTNSEVQFPKQKGWYSLSELAYLSNSLGFDSSVFTKVIFSEKECLETKGLSEKKFIEMLNLKMFDKYLDSTFNNKPAKYNVMTIKKALQLLRHKVIGFPELSQARMAYFLYENDDQLGMDADGTTILKALKLCDRLMSPVHLDKYLVDMSLSVQIPCRLQLFEFLELLSLTMRIDEIPMTKLQEKEKANNSDYFQVIQTKEQKAMDILDEQFRALNPQPADKSVKNKKKTHSRQLSIIQNTDYDSVVSVAQDQAAELLSSVEISTAHLRTVRSGHYLLPSAEQDERAGTSLSFTHSTKQMGQRQGLKFQFRKLPSRKLWHHKTFGSPCSDVNECTQNHDRKHSKSKYRQETAQHAEPTTKKLIPPVNVHSNTTINHWIPYQTPLITQAKVDEHQYRIDTLKWDMLRKETTSVKSLHCTLPSSAAPCCKSGKQHHKFASQPAIDMDVLSIINQLNETADNNHTQRPTTTRSLSRSKSVNFKLN